MSTDRANLVRIICGEIAEAVASVDSPAIGQAIAAIQDANRIFVFGEGRSGLALRMGAMRLVHLGKTVHIVGDATTPAISGDDLLIAGSGSGETEITVLITGQARKAGASVLAITANPVSQLGELADVVLSLRTPAKGNRGEGASVQPGGTLFEQSTLVLLDQLFLVLAGDSASDQINKRHANLE